jgi:hypothetical protein
LLLKTPFEHLETSLGWNYRVDGLLWSEWFPEVASPADHTMYDWMHVFCVHGIANIEVPLLLGALATINVDHAAIHVFLQSVVWPKHIHGKGMTGNTAFEKKNSSSLLSCSASELMSYSDY